MIKPNWIPIKEQAPPIGEVVLIRFRYAREQFRMRPLQEDYDYTIGAYEGEADWIDYYRSDESYPVPGVVTHWCPIDWPEEVPCD